MLTFLADPEGAAGTTATAASLGPGSVDEGGAAARGSWPDGYMRTGFKQQLDCLVPSCELGDVTRRAMDGVVGRVHGVKGPTGWGCGDVITGGSVAKGTNVNGRWVRAKLRAALAARQSA